MNRKFIINITDQKEFKKRGKASKKKVLANFNSLSPELKASIKELLETGNSKITIVTKEDYNTYPAIFHKHEDGYYIVNIPDLPICMTDGETVEKAMKMAEDALSSYLSVSIEEDIKYNPPTDFENFKNVYKDIIKPNDIILLVKANI